jgi:ABC-type antimicrobial peptide transport system permease subunit
MRAHITATLRPTLIAGVVLGALSAIGLVLAMAGLYSVVSYAAKRRTLEFGIRMALGATTRMIMRDVLAHALSVVAIGCSIGVVFAIGAAVVLSPFSASGQAVVDIPVLAATLGAIASVSVLASIWPAAQAGRADAATALRSE